ncbi:MAG: phosphatase PAP2 family protein [bacterium]|nr:phosphatase PAP2 family protein [bacterium]
MWVAMGLTLICALLVAPSRSRRRTGTRPLFKGTGRHWRRNYASRRTFLRLGAAVAAAGVLAYSGADEALSGFYENSVRSKGTDRASGLVKHAGERFWFVNWLLVAVVDAWLRTNAFTRWGRRNFEAMVVGLPTLWTLQRGLGANRPSSDEADPRWRPLAADNAASGHAFIAAVPWLTLARRNHAPAMQPLARLASAATGWSRLNDQKHYLSQVVLGWTIAWNAVEAVADDPPAAPDTPEETSCSAS